MTVVSQETTEIVFDPREMISAELYADLVRRTARDHELDTAYAERLVNQCLVFLKACATATTPLHPTRRIDWAWHMFILHTRDYTAFCERVAGRYMHHQPDDGAKDQGRAVRKTVAIIRGQGLPVDQEIWDKVDATNCENACSHYA